MTLHRHVTPLTFALVAMGGKQLMTEYRESQPFTLAFTTLDANIKCGMPLDLTVAGVNHCFVSLRK